MSAEFFVGLDLGQSRDFTAVAILERAELTGPWDAVTLAYRKTAALRLRYLERLALGTSYVEVVERVREITRSAALKGRCRLMVDATGVGRPVVDLLRRAGLECPMLAAVITSGYAETLTNGYYHVPKRDMIVGLQVLLQRKTLQIAAGLEYGPALVEEMMAMQVRQTASGHEQFGAWREGEHDDLVFAVALAYWGAKKAYPQLDGRQGHWTRDPEPFGAEDRKRFQRAATPRGYADSSDKGD